MNNLFFAQLKKELFVAITERESVTGKCETLNDHSAKMIPPVALK